ncbi:MAG TPA: DUF4136 domain-containing protein [Paenalcaligenes sp.]|nr:DUF4136 domain-containing protein [Paenalcaligenes sp.]
MQHAQKLIRYFFIMVVGLLLLGGCAQTWSARVQQFEQWPDNAADATYHIELSDEQQNNLEFQAVADAVRAAIGSVGLVESDADNARFTLRVDFHNPLQRRWVERYQGPMFSPFGGFWGGGAGPFWGGGIYYGPDWVVTPVDVYENQLTVRLLDNEQAGKEVYRATARSESEEEELLMQLSLLAQAVFEDFPGINGQTRIIEKRLDQ